MIGQFANAQESAKLFSKADELNHWSAPRVTENSIGEEVPKFKVPVTLLSPFAVS